MNDHSAFFTFPRDFSDRTLSSFLQVGLSGPSDTTLPQPEIGKYVKLGLCWFGIACCPFSGLVSLIVFNLALASWSSTCTICARISIRAWLSWKTPGSGFRSSYSPSAPSSPAVASACHPHLPWRKHIQRGPSFIELQSDKVDLPL